MISFIVPAHNEETCLGRTLLTIHESARAIGQPYEIVVADDASTDATAEIARQNHAQVVSVNNRQIAATRNAGARASTGERLFFVDADTTINPRAVAAGLRAMDKGAVGGGAPTWFAWNDPVPLYGRILAALIVLFVKPSGFCGGAFMFCTREAFLATGGFNEKVYWSEEGFFALALKREGRFVGLWQPVITSGRRLRKTSALEFLAGSVRMIFSPVKMVTERASVEKVWYDSNRTSDHILPNSWIDRISNGIALVFMLMVLSGPFWGFVPRSLTPISTILGKARFATAFFLSHAGLLFWPCGVILIANLLRQKRWTGLIQSTVLIAFCAWQAWDSTHGVIRIWTTITGWLMGS